MVDRVAGDEAQRWLIRVTGVVQGVGYRPFVYNLAIARGLRGWVLNDTLGVQVEVSGPVGVLTAFTESLRTDAPLLARVSDVQVVQRAADGVAPVGFEIRQSARIGPANTIVAPDSHVCEDCLREVDDPADRRYRYPFTNCTHCGPRYSLIRGLPYDRAQTTMAAFTMCARCRREYEDPADRRYHAQPNACPDCGPRLTLAAPDGPLADGDDALCRAVEALAAGKIVAVKSVGGFHLAVDARDGEAVARLRRRKKRDAKPFAVLAGDVATARGFAVVERHEEELLCSPARPIVLLRKRPATLPDSIAPRNPSIAVMLPSAPLHHLLVAGPGPDVIVCTSGNVSGYPIVFRNADALDQLFEVADLVLLHDREIETRVDDSVVRCTTHPELTEPLVTFLRRSRGYAPYPVTVAREQAPVTAYGAELKTTVALANGDRVYVSQHIGDLKNDETLASHQQTAAHLAALYELKPRYVACDLHPAFRSGLLAEADGAGTVLRVQHHHAHMASCMAENQLSGDALGVVMDGAGYGTDGTIWGGEFLLGDLREVRRVAHLRPVRLLGGDRAVHEPIRTGFALAVDAFGDAGRALAAFPVLGELTDEQRRVFAVMLRRGVNAPVSAGMGRLFDGIAALLGICTRAEYEAHGPIELEGLLGRELDLDQPYPFEHTDDELDHRPLVRAFASDLANGVDPATISRRFHSAVVAAVVARARIVAGTHGAHRVVLSGGVFLNEFLVVNCLVELRRAGFDAYCHRLVPANDGGISLGQIVVASARLAAAGPESGRNRG